MEKNKDSGFYETELDSELKKLNIDTVVITGMQTQICVQTTAADAFFRGYNIWVPADCVVSARAEDKNRALEWLAGIPLIVDEIQTGFGRTGKMFAFEYSGITPDAVVISKAIGGGFPLSAVLYDGRYDTWSPGAHAGTFRGNQIAMLAGKITLDILESEKLVGGALLKGEILSRKLHRLAEHYDCIGEVRGRGLMWGLEIVDSNGTKDKLGSYPADGDLAMKIKKKCLDNGLIIERGGRFGAVLRLLPPLVITNNEISELVEKLERSIKECLS